MNQAAEFPWARFLSWARVVLSAVALAWVWRGTMRVTYSLVLLALFLAAALAIAIRGRGPRGLLGMLALFADAVYFLIIACFGGGRSLWLAALFFLYLLVGALVFSGPVEVGVIAVVCALFFTVLRDPQMRPLEAMVVVAGALAYGFAVFKRRQAGVTEQLVRKLAEGEKAVERAREEERQRIASDFHDGPLQSFISLQMRLEILRKIFDRDTNAGLQDLKQLQALAQSQVRDLRAFLHSMRPVDVDGSNLAATLRRTAETFQKETGIPVTFVGSSTPVGLPPEFTLEVLQMLREALHNVQKHAGATRVAVTMEKTDHGLEISVDDNGHGFNFAGTYSLEELELLRLGPASLKRRARGLNADLVLESRPGRGAGIKFRIPQQ